MKFLCLCWVRISFIKLLLVFTIGWNVGFGVLSLSTRRRDIRSTEMRDECINPNGKFGVCVPLQSCPHLFQFLQENPWKPQKIKFLQRATCNFHRDEPWVCCHNEQRGSNPSNSSTSPNVLHTEQPDAQNKGQEAELDTVEIHSNFKLLPSIKHCGLSLVTDRIIGGTAAGLGAYPYMALLSYKDPDGVNSFACGGTLINPRYVLTASHCLAKLPGGFKLDFVRLGEYDQSTDPDYAENGLCAPKAMDVPVEETIIHEKYDENGKTENDIALIRLGKEITFGPFTSPVCLPRRNMFQHNLEKSNFTVVAGFGRIRWNVERNSDVLQHVHVPVRSTRECNDFYSRQKIGKVDDSRFCAGGVSGKDSCQGDSGGPLIDSIYNEKLLQVQAFQFGIVSLGPSPCGSSNPALYTNVSHFMPWILDHLKP